MANKVTSSIQKPPANTESYFERHKWWIGILFSALASFAIAMVTSSVTVSNAIKVENEKVLSKRRLMLEKISYELVVLGEVFKNLDEVSNPIHLAAIPIDDLCPYLKTLGGKEKWESPLAYRECILIDRLLEDLDEAKNLQLSLTDKIKGDDGTATELGFYELKVASRKVLKSVLIFRTALKELNISEPEQKLVKKKVPKKAVNK